MALSQKDITTALTTTFFCSFRDSDFCKKAKSYTLGPSERQIVLLMLCDSCFIKMSLLLAISNYIKQ